MNSEPHNPGSPLESELDDALSVSQYPLGEEPRRDTPPPAYEPTPNLRPDIYPPGEEPR